MATIRRFEEIEAWQLARELTVNVYTLTKRPLFSQDFGLKEQIRRAAGSTMHNIAEGFDAGSDAEFTRFLRYARRSASEVQSQLYIALDQGYLTDDEFQELYQQSQRCKYKINALIGYLKKSRRPQRKP